MNIITKVKITGFWDTYQFSTRLNPDINFFIGENGSGKTTAINIIAAALNADFPTLDRLSFEKISIDLREVKGKGKSLIEVSKTPRKKSPFPEIRYQITDKLTGKMDDYSLDSYEEQLSFREYPQRYYREYRKAPRPDMIEHLRHLVNVSWLSIHRAESSRPLREERSYESTIDRKLDDLSGDFVRYLSQLNKQGDSETAKFQQKAFLSLIKQQTTDSLLSAIATMNLDDERKALVDIFRKFRVDEQTFSTDISSHFNKVEKARNDLKKRKKLQFDHVISLITMLRIHLVVQEWVTLIKRQEEIYEPRDTFLNTINDMIIGKRLEINDRNEFVATSDSNRLFTLKQLSSGEKQLFIILGEALLQQKTPWVYIADEPELSLHVAWQSQLTNSLIKVNPNAQIIFATHSPDIVSQYESKTISMTRVIR